MDLATQLSTEIVGSMALLHLRHSREVERESI